jgi:hypothetical protein
MLLLSNLFDPLVGNLAIILAIGEGPIVGGPIVQGRDRGGGPIGAYDETENLALLCFIFDSRLAMENLVNLLQGFTSVHPNQRGHSISEDIATKTELTHLVSGTKNHVQTPERTENTPKNMNVP